ncbi:cell division/cell wall cluster transcriptional repressor MraZ [Paracoccus spongiarum]|uniref:Transcriptional regulator MraZ n=1 Tax=Paracoccus spongiarum TaxID=3064387 RepID=A0ABT9JF29_9RHOB|nr:cell division/cell wall cluster transcriptional repressor MraZ [Paracoccus sp. 2205BS29-5]MDP5307666.1 cell division/cell wall cluster transcriptional repressor MraZ [Paracoccus sp. 2205BS29-5]
MARKFRGTETVKVDGKGRMSVPARMRKHFELCDPDFATSNTGRAQLVAVHGPDWWNWLELYTIDAIAEIDEQIDGLTRGSIERRWLEQLMNGQSIELEIDREGRLMLPQKLREKLGFANGAEVTFASSGDYLKVYLPESPPKDVAEVEEFAAAKGDGFDPRVYVGQAATEAGTHGPISGSGT